MKILFRVLLALLLPCVCDADEVKVPAFFPPGTFSKAVVARYSGHLEAMREEALPPLTKKKEALVYRFTCLETFDHPFTIKITKTKAGFLLRRIVLSGRGGYAPGEIKESVEAELKPEDVAGLQTLLAETKFNELKAHEPEDEQYSGTDGSKWFLEVVRDGKYRIVDRWSPGKEDPVRKIGEWFLGAAKWKPEEPPVFFPPSLEESAYGCSRHLTAVSEEVLPPLAEKKETVVYRLTCRQEFTPSFSIKIKKTEPGFQSRRVVLSGRAGQGSGKIRESVESELNPEAVAGLEKLLVETKFNEMKAIPDEGDGNDANFGGTQWLVEVVRDGGYRAVTDWAPSEASAMRKIGEAFFEAVMWKPEELPRYFLPDTFHNYTADWYASQLAAMKEEALPPLAKNKEAEIYRFTCLRTFHEPFVIKITKAKNGFRLRRVVLSGKGGYDPGEVKESVELVLKPESMVGLGKLLEETKFSEMSATEEDIGGTDGSQWLLEVVKGGEYRMVDRWTPREGTAARKIGEWFLRAAKWKPQELY